MDEIGQVETGILLQPMSLAGDDDVRIAPELTDVDANVGRWPTHHGEIEVVAVHGLADLLAISDGELDLDLRIALRECGDGMRHEILGGRDCAEMHRAAGPSCEQIERALAISNRRFDAFGEGQHLLSSL